MERQVLSTFSTIMVKSMDPDFECQEDLIKWIYDARERDPEGTKMTNRGGWQSKHSNFFNTDRTFQPFINYIIERVSESFEGVVKRPVSITDLWVNINPPGAYNLEHDHAEGHFTAVLWVKAPEGSGQFVMKNPNGYAQYSIIESFEDTLSNFTTHVCGHDPSDGDLLIIPSHIRHLVDTNYSTEDRISVAFNLKLVNQ